MLVQAHEPRVDEDHGIVVELVQGVASNLGLDPVRNFERRLADEHELQRMVILPERGNDVSAQGAGPLSAAQSFRPPITAQKCSLAA